MVNKRRGETSFEVGGEKYTMCMTLGAMAEIEEHFELDSIADLPTIFTGDGIKATSLIALLGALLRGGGEDLTNEDIGMFDLDAVEAFSAAMDAIAVQTPTTKKPPPKRKATAKKKR